MSAPEFSRLVDPGRLGDGERDLVADAQERTALASRFGLVAIHRLEARLVLTPEDGTVNVEGQLLADIVQSCAVSGEDLAVRLDEPITLRFVPAAEHRPDEEVELDAAECDEIEFEGNVFDLGEAVAQSLALAIDPFATGPEANEARRDAGITSDDTPSGSLAKALKSLRDAQD